jgi:predicted GNAT family acetyltransferase
MEIKHDIENGRVWTEIDGMTAEVEYEVNDGSLNVVHTYVPKELEGQGIASKLVQFTFDYAYANGLKPAATCWYAKAWLERHKG